MNKKEKAVIKLLKSKELFTLQVEKVNEDGKKEMMPVIANGTQNEICFAISLKIEEKQLLDEVMKHAK